MGRYTGTMDRAESRRRQARGSLMDYRLDGLG